MTVLRFLLLLIFFRRLTTSVGLETTTSRNLIPSFCPFRKYHIALDFDNLCKLDQLVVRRAACRWSQIIRSDRPAINLKNSSLRTDCGAYPSRIDDLYICASSRRIDRLGDVVAVAVPTIYRTDYTPLAGFIQIDAYDIDMLKQDKTFFGTILHEMGHMLGLNYYTWKNLNLVGDESATPACPYRLDSNATREWQKITGCYNDSVPVDKSYACSHWGEKCMQQELMTGYIEPGDSLKISKITIGSLEDMGYKVNYRKSGKYTSKDVYPACLCNNNAVESENSTMTDPLGGAGGPEQQKQLSDKGRAEAEAHGRAFILANSMNQTLPQQQQQQQQQDETQEVLPYLPGFTAFVMYQENDTVYSVPVTL